MIHSNNQVGTVEERIAAQNRHKAIEERVLEIRTAARNVYDDCLRHHWAPEVSALNKLRQDLATLARWSAHLDKACDGEPLVEPQGSALIDAADAAADYLSDGPAAVDEVAVRRGVLTQLTVALAQARGERIP